MKRLMTTVAMATALMGTPALAADKYELTYRGAVVSTHSTRLDCQAAAKPLIDGLNTNNVAEVRHATPLELAGADGLYDSNQRQLIIIKKIGCRKAKPKPVERKVFKLLRAGKSSLTVVDIFTTKEACQALADALPKHTCRSTIERGSD